MGDLVSVFVYREEGRAENARSVEDFAHADGYVALQVFARLAALCSGRVVELRAYSLPAFVVDVSCGIAPVFGYEYIAVGNREIVDDIVPCYRLLVVLDLSS